MTTAWVREILRSDLDRVAAICRQALVYDSIPADELVKLLWEDPDFDQRYCLMAEVEGAPVGIAFGVMRQDPKAGTLGFIKLMAVLPERQRQGVGKSLAAELERRLAASGAAEIRVGPSAPRYVFPGVDIRYTEAYCFFRDLGYKRYHDATNMTVDLARAPLDTQAEEAALLAQGIEIRRLAETDRAKFEEYMVRWGSGWQWEGLSALRQNPVSCHVALHNGEFVGFSAYDTNRRGWFGPMGTEQSMRKFGIGRILLKRCLKDQRNLGYGTVQIAWTGPFHFYAKAVGARMEREFWMMKKELVGQ